MENQNQTQETSEEIQQENTVQDQKQLEQYDQQLQKTLNDQDQEDNKQQIQETMSHEKKQNNSFQTKIEGHTGGGGSLGLSLAQQLAQFQQHRQIDNNSGIPNQQQQIQQQQLLQQQLNAMQQQQGSPDSSGQNIAFSNNKNYDDNKNKRRTKNDPNNRDFLCGCGKSYLSYPAFYTHIKQKHNGQQPSGTVLPPSNKGVRGRPKKDEKQDQKVDQIDDRSDYSDDMFEPLDDLFYYISEISKKINPNNEYSYIQDISLESIDCKKCFPANLFQKVDDYAPLLDSLEIVQSSKGQIPEQMDATRGVKNVSCNYIFAKFLYCISKHLKEPCYQEIAFLIAAYRIVLNQFGWKIRQEEYEEEVPENPSEFCEENLSETIPDICNDFISDHFPKYIEQNKDLLGHFKIIGPSEEQQKNAICIISYFCNWMFTNKYTNSKLSMNNDDEDFLNYDPLYNDMENDDEENEDSQDSDKEDDGQKSLSDL